MPSRDTRDGKGAVLVVEDLWIVAEQTRCDLEDAGFTVVGPVPSVAEALALIANEPMDAAVLDIRLRGETSYPIAEALLARSIPFVFTTGFAVADLPLKFRDGPCLGKPYAVSKLVAVLRGLVAEARQCRHVGTGDRAE